MGVLREVFWTNPSLGVFLELAAGFDERHPQIRLVGDAAPDIQQMFGDGGKDGKRADGNKSARRDDPEPEGSRVLDAPDARSESERHDDADDQAAGEHELARKIIEKVCPRERKVVDVKLLLQIDPGDGRRNRKA